MNPDSPDRDDESAITNPESSPSLSPWQRFMAKLKAQPRLSGTTQVPYIADWVKPWHCSYTAHYDEKAGEITLSLDILGPFGHDQEYFRLRADDNFSESTLLTYNTGEPAMVIERLVHIIQTVTR